METTEDYISDVVLEFHKKQEKLTKEQFQDCLMEAISSGDFMRHCTDIHSAHHKYPNETLGEYDEFVISSSQKMTYKPYREVEYLKEEVAKLKSELKDYKIVHGEFLNAR